MSHAFNLNTYVCSQGIPVREALQAMYKINRDKTLKEAFLFLCWTVLFVGIVFAVNDIHLTFSTNDSLIDLFLDEEFAEYVPSPDENLCVVVLCTQRVYPYRTPWFPSFFSANYKKNFHEIMTMGELWTFIQGPVFEGLYPLEWYNGRNYTGECTETCRPRLCLVSSLTPCHGVAPHRK